jgi:hypothetical protein
VLYVGQDTAPLGITPLFPDETLFNWTFQLGLRSETTEALVAYEERLTYPRFHFLPIAGIYLIKGEYPRKYLSNSSYTQDRGELDDFVFGSLGIDLHDLLTVPTFLPRNKP